MNVSLEYLEKCSAETGFQASVLEKVICLGALAAEIARHPLLGKILALKGGTALNLCFGPPKRLSVDIDFNYIGHLDRAKMLTDKPIVENAVISLAANENDYLAAVQRGELKMELLIPNDMDKAKHMAEHPVILWKVHNASEYFKRQRKTSKN